MVVGVPGHQGVPVAGRIGVSGAEKAFDGGEVVKRFNAGELEVVADAEPTLDDRER